MGILFEIAFSPDLEPISKAMKYRQELKFHNKTINSLLVLDVYGLDLDKRKYHLAQNSKMLTMSFKDFPT